MNKPQIRLTVQRIRISAPSPSVWEFICNADFLPLWWGGEACEATARVEPVFGKGARIIFEGGNLKNGLVTSFRPGEGMLVVSAERYDLIELEAQDGETLVTVESYCDDPVEYREHAGEYTFLNKTRLASLKTLVEHSAKEAPPVEEKISNFIITGMVGDLGRKLRIAGFFAVAALLCVLEVFIISSHDAFVTPPDDDRIVPEYSITLDSPLALDFKSGFSRRYIEETLFSSGVTLENGIVVYNSYSTLPSGEPQLRLYVEYDSSGTARRFALFDTLVASTRMNFHNFNLADEITSDSSIEEIVDAAGSAPSCIIWDGGNSVRYMFGYFFGPHDPLSVELYCETEITIDPVNDFVSVLFSGVPHKDDTLSAFSLTEPLKLQFSSFDQYVEARRLYDTLDIYIGLSHPLVERIVGSGHSVALSHGSETRRYELEQGSLYLTFVDDAVTSARFDNALISASNAYMVNTSPYPLYAEMPVKAVRDILPFLPVSVSVTQNEVMYFYGGMTGDVYAYGSFQYQVRLDRLDMTVIDCLK